MTRAMLVRNAKNVLQFTLNSVAMQYELGLISDEELEECRLSQKDEDRVPEDLKYYDIGEGIDAILSTEDWTCENGDTYMVGLMGNVHKHGKYDIEITASSDLDELAQIPLTFEVESWGKNTVSFRGTNGKTVTEKRDLGLIIGTHYLKLYFGGSGLDIKEIKISFREEFKFH